MLFFLSVTPILFLPFSWSSSGGKQEERVINAMRRHAAAATGGESIQSVNK